MNTDVIMMFFLYISFTEFVTSNKTCILRWVVGKKKKMPFCQMRIVLGNVEWPSKTANVVAPLWSLFWAPWMEHSLGLIVLQLSYRIKWHWLKSFQHKSEISKYLKSAQKVRVQVFCFGIYWREVERQQRKIKHLFNWLPSFNCKCLFQQHMFTSTC